MAIFQNWQEYLELNITRITTLLHESQEYDDLAKIFEEIISDCGQIDRNTDHRQSMSLNSLSDIFYVFILTLMNNLIFHQNFNSYYILMATWLGERNCQPTSYHQLQRKQRWRKYKVFVQSRCRCDNYDRYTRILYTQRRITTAMWMICRSMNIILWRSLLIDKWVFRKQFGE